MKSRENICYVDTQLVNGRIRYEKKKATNLTRSKAYFTLITSAIKLIHFIVEKSSDGNINFQEYQKKLNGKLDYSAPTKDLYEFSGYLKLKKDPKPDQVTIQNLILRGSILMNTDW